MSERTRAAVDTESWGVANAFEEMERNARMVGQRTRTPTVVMASGVFDMLHRGHMNLLWRAKQLGDVLVVGVVSDAGTEAYKGRRPVENEADRLRAIGTLGFVDVALPQAGTDPTPLLHRVLPDILCHGSDWSELREGQETVRALGIQWVVLPYTPDISSTQLREVL